MNRRQAIALTSARRNPAHTGEVDHLARLAGASLERGVLEEPRVYYDQLLLGTTGAPTVNNPNVFVNGEQFPVQITHLTAAILPDYAQASGLDERVIQRMGMRIRYHDNFYMTSTFMGLPLWSNVVAAAPALVTSGVASYEFIRPVILSARDAFEVNVALEDVPASAVRISASFSGVGLLSKRPYFFGSSLQVTDSNVHMLPIQDLRNDGAEPIAITDMTLHVGAELSSQTGAGDIRRAKVAIKQVGNGTQAKWFQGATSPTPHPRCPMSLLGKTAGRAIVHELPAQGFLLEPGEGFTIEALALATAAQNLALGVAAHGFLQVT